jgi:hypothetical protein
MNGLLISAQVENITTRKDHTIKITLGTSELSPSRAGELIQLMNKIAAVYISEKAIDQKEIDQVDKMDPEFGGKTQSQRLRGVLFVSFEQNPEGFKEFDAYYRNKMNVIIEHYKSKLQ